MIKMYSFECKVEEIEKLRIPYVYRVHSRCKDIVIVIEMHENITSIEKGEKIIIELTKDKNKCMENYFCGKGYVVSVTEIENKYRIIISIGGFLVVLKELEKPLEISVLDELYIGISKK